MGMSLDIAAGYQVAPPVGVRKAWATSEPHTAGILGLLSIIVALACAVPMGQKAPRPSCSQTRPSAFTPHCTVFSLKASPNFLSMVLPDETEEVPAMTRKEIRSIDTTQN